MGTELGRALGRRAMTLRMSSLSSSCSTRLFPCCCWWLGAAAAAAPALLGAAAGGGGGLGMLAAGRLASPWGVDDGGWILGPSVGALVAAGGNKAGAALAAVGAWFMQPA